VDPGVLTLVACEGMRDIAHLLRPGHLRQLRAILEDPEASPNDRYVARELLQNACIAAGGVLPMCQHTGTAIIMGKRGGGVLTDGRDSEYPELGMEAVWQIEVRDFPAFIIVDDKGNDFFTDPAGEGPLLTIGHS